MYLLDTDTVSLLLGHASAYPQLVTRTRAVPDDELFVSIITVEEVLRGALDLVRKSHRTPKEPDAYAFFLRQLQHLRTFQVLPFDAAAHARFLALPPEVRRRGPQDCRIACIAVSRGFTVVTRNTRDFARIAGVKCEDWTAA